MAAPSSVAVAVMVLPRATRFTFTRNLALPLSSVSIRTKPMKRRAGRLRGGFAKSSMPYGASAGKLR